MGQTFKQMDKDTAQDEEQTAPQDPAKDSKQNMDNYQPMLSQSKSGKKKFVVAAVIIVTFLATGWVIKSGSRSAESEIKTGSQPIPTPLPTPSATPAVKPERSGVSFEVLNGSGVTGAAKKLADQLKELGYEVLKTANADKDSYTQNQIYIKAELKGTVDLVIADLKDIIKIASVAGELKEGTASARIIIGKD